MAKVDAAKRRRVMQRSRQLGHCICDPRKPCPCDVFTEQGLCPCAGDRPEPVDLAQVRLTEMVHNAGCASKIAPADLEGVLSRLPRVEDPAVLSGIPAGDDAGVYALTADVTLVQTVDVFTPCVDDPRLFGRICAANCLSDVYAMGGVPRTALSILGFPSETLDGQIMYQMLAGAMEVFQQAGVALIGGHSIKDAEIKLGFAVTGTVERDKLARNDSARVGDVLVLTKPLGTGVLTFARQIGRLNSAQLAPAERSMAELNKSAAEAMAEAGCSAATDVTGFGLFGHLMNMARHSGVTAQIDAGALPALEGAVAALSAGVVPGAIERNREFLGEDLSVADGVEEARLLLGLDAQTSGGLLIAVPAERHQRLLEALARRSVQAWTIGRITERSAGRIVVAPSAQQTTARAPASVPAATPAATPNECCADAHAAETPAGGAPEAFAAFMRAASGAGRIDARTKELIHFALVLLARCEPCFAAHYQKAREMGITREELDELAWCATAMGGAPVRMFYLDQLKAHPQDKGKSAQESKNEGECCHES